MRCLSPPSARINHRWSRYTASCSCAHVPWQTARRRAVYLASSLAPPAPGLLRLCYLPWQPFPSCHWPLTQTQLHHREKEVSSRNVAYGNYARYAQANKSQSASAVPPQPVRHPTASSRDSCLSCCPERCGRLFAQRQSCKDVEARRRKLPSSPCTAPYS
jgi:hypothetical protein